MLSSSVKTVPKTDSAKSCHQPKPLSPEVGGQVSVPPMHPSYLRCMAQGDLGGLRVAVKTTEAAVDCGFKE